MTEVYDEHGNYLGDDGEGQQPQMTQEQYQQLVRQQQQEHNRMCAASLAPPTPFKRANFFEQMNTNVNHLQKKIRRV